MCLANFGRRSGRRLILAGGGSGGVDLTGSRVVSAHSSDGKGPPTLRNQLPRGDITAQGLPPPNLKGKANNNLPKMHRPAKNAQTCQKHGRYLPKHAQICQNTAGTCQSVAHPCVIHLLAFQSCRYHKSTVSNLPRAVMSNLWREGDP